jgi:hypothetical protein
MTDPVVALIEAGLDSFEPFAPDSRYRGVPLAEHVAADGRRIRYVRRRFVPRAAAQTQIGEHLVGGSDRPDTIAAAHLGNPQQFWRVCDDNDVMRPSDLTAVPGRRLRIALPAPGPVPGA